MPFPTPDITTAECLFSFWNDVTGEFFWTAVLIMIFVVVFGIQKHRKNKTIIAFATASWFTGILSMFLTIINCDGKSLVASDITLILVGVSILSVIILSYREKG